MWLYLRSSGIQRPCGPHPQACAQLQTGAAAQQCHAFSLKYDAMKLLSGSALKAATPPAAAELVVAFLPVLIPVAVLVVLLVLVVLRGEALQQGMQQCSWPPTVRAPGAPPA